MEKRGTRLGWGDEENVRMVQMEGKSRDGIQDAWLGEKSKELGVVIRYIISRLLIIDGTEAIKDRALYSMIDHALPFILNKISRFHSNYASVIFSIRTRTQSKLCFIHFKLTRDPRSNDVPQDQSFLYHPSMAASTREL